MNTGGSVKSLRTSLVGVSIAVASVLLLAGCAPASQPEPTSTAEASATPTQTPTPTPTLEADPLESVTGLVARPTVLELRDASGAVLLSLDYMSSPADAIAALTVVFGTPPSDEEYRGTNHTPPGMKHSWGTFVLDERFYDEERRASEGYDYVWPRFAVYFDAAASGDIALSSAHGHQAGDSWESILTSPEFRPDVLSCNGTPIDTAEVSSGARQVGVIVRSTEDNNSVKWIGAPESVGDGGCA